VRDFIANILPADNQEQKNLSPISLQARVIEAKRKIAKLKTKYTDNHPDVVSAKAELQKLNLLTNLNEPGWQEFYVSDIQVKFKEIAELFLGKEIDHVHKVDLEELLQEHKG